MKLLCKTCGNQIEDTNIKRCPRCYSVLKEPLKCGDCKGCALGFRDCKTESKRIFSIENKKF